MDYTDLLADLETTLAKHAPGGMVGAIVMAVELYDEQGEPRLHTVRSDTLLAYKYRWTNNPPRIREA